MRSNLPTTRTLARFSLVALADNSQPAESRAYCARVAADGVQLPSRIDGGVDVGQYKRITKTNFPFGAGSQFASFALPGESACRYMSTEPSLLVMNLLRWLNS